MIKWSWKWIKRQTRLGIHKLKFKFLGLFIDYDKRAEKFLQELKNGK